MEKTEFEKQLEVSLISLLIASLPESATDAKTVRTILSDVTRFLNGEISLSYDRVSGLLVGRQIEKNVLK